MTPTAPAQNDLFSRHRNVALRAASRAWGSVHKPGLDLEDAQQEASLKLLQLAKREKFQALDEEAQRKYLTVAVRRTVARLATQTPDLISDDGAIPDDRWPLSTIDLYDVQTQVAAINDDAAVYIQYRVLDGLSWGACLTVLGWTNNRLNAARQAASDAVLNILETKCNQ